MPVRHERSAGVIAYRVGDAREPEFLLLDYGKHWDYPKGHLEQGEDEAAAALRELAEETGFDDVDLIEGFRHEITYMFRDKRKGLIRKTVAMFLGQTNAKRAKISDEHVGAEFLPYEQAYERLTYKNAKDALAAARQFIESHSPA